MRRRGGGHSDLGEGVRPSRGRGADWGSTPADNVDTYKKKITILFKTPRKTTQALGVSGGTSECVLGEGVGRGELVFYPLPNSHLLSAPIHLELTDSIAFSRGKEPAQCRGLFSSTLAHRALGNIRE